MPEISDEKLFAAAAEGKHPPRRIVRRRFAPDDPALKLVLHTAGDSRRIVGTFLEYSKEEPRDLIWVEILIEE